MAFLRIVQPLGAALLVLALTGCVQTPEPVATGNVTAAPPQITERALMGATPVVLNADFGQPALLRVDGPAQVWLYHSPVCGLNLILFPDHAGVPRVADVVPDNADPLSCMQSLQQHGATDAALDAAPAS